MGEFETKLAIEIADFFHADKAHTNLTLTLTLTLKTDVTDLAVYASGRARVEHITQQVSSDYQVEVLQGEGTDEP